MKMYVRFFLLMLSFSMVFSGCKKDKKPEFTTNKDTYTQGDLITTTNTSPKSSKYYYWLFGGGDEIEGKEPTYQLSKTQTVGDFIIQCTSTDNEGSRSSARTNSKTVKIVEAKQAKLIFWQLGLMGASTNIIVSIGADSDTLTTRRDTDPYCNTFNTVQFEGLKAGSVMYTVRNLDTGESSTKTVDLADGFECKSVKIEL